MMAALVLAERQAEPTVLGRVKIWFFSCRRERSVRSETGVPLRIGIMDHRTLFRPLNASQHEACNFLFQS